MQKKSHFVKHFLLWVLGHPFHAVTLRKYFIYMRVKLNYRCNAKRYFIDTDSFIVHIKTRDVCEGLKKKIGHIKLWN